VTTTGPGLSPETDLISDNQLDDYSYIIEDHFTLDKLGVLLRCTSGVGHQGNTSLGGWYFNGTEVETGDVCDSVFQMRSMYSDAINHAVINLYPCGPLSPDKEGIYTCMMKNSSMKVQSTRVGLYLNGRSESLDIYPFNSLLFYPSLYSVAPVIDPPSPSTVKVPVHNPITISCSSRGSPPDTFIWMKDGSPVTSSSTLNTVIHDSTNAVFHSYYTIKNVTRSGRYTCTVTNPIGSDSQTISVVAVSGKLTYSIMSSSQQ